MVVCLTMVDIIEGKPVFEVFVWGSSGVDQLQKYFIYNTHTSIYLEKK